MKKFGIFMLASVALVAVSCSSADETVQEETVEPITYTLDAASSTLTWGANMGPDYGHTGTVDVTEGSMTMEGDAVTSGSFTVDMNSIKVTDLDEPKAGYLEGHLKGTMVDEDHPVDLFFNTPAFPTVGVTLGDYADGKLDLTLSILGKELDQTVDVAVAADENGATLKGSFELDLDSIMIPGLQPNPEDGSAINSVMNFELDLVMTK